VIAILFASARIETGRLNVAVGGWTDPDFFIGGRDADRFDAADDVLVGDAFVVLSQ
jgi:hypothetical protein